VGVKNLGLKPEAEETEAETERLVLRPESESEVTTILQAARNVQSFGGHTDQCLCRRIWWKNETTYELRHIFFVTG
jgi:hypothetical protein